MLLHKTRILLPVANFGNLQKPKANINNDMKLISINITSNAGDKICSKRNLGFSVIKKKKWKKS